MSGESEEAEKMIGQIVIWEDEFKASNVVWTGDVAVVLENDRFLGVHGTVKNKIFYESNTYYRKLTHEEELELFYK